MGITTNYDPEKVTLLMSGCTLRNNKEVAQMIMDGAHKQVCAWILCDVVGVLERLAVVGTKDNHLMYNPKKCNHWVMNGEDMDGEVLPLIYSSGRELYVPENKSVRLKIT
jgi:hypothetical protein